jgi:hypothetical protein
MSIAHIPAMSVARAPAMSVGAPAMSYARVPCQSIISTAVHPGPSALRRLPENHKTGSFQGFSAAQVLLASVTMPVLLQWKQASLVLAIHQLKQV